MSVRRAIKTFAVTGVTCCSLWLASPQTGAAQSLSGPSTDQQLEELKEQRLEFDSFGWPAKGRFPKRSAALERYVEFNSRIWGVQAGANVGAHVKLELGVTDGNGDGTLNSIGSVTSSELAYAGAVSFTNLFPQLGDGEIRIGLVASKCKKFRHFSCAHRGAYPGAIRVDQ